MSQPREVATAPRVATTPDDLLTEQRTAVRPFFDRQEELGYLNRQLKLYQRGEQLHNLVNVYGFPGIGKTALLDRWRAQLISEGVPTMAFRAFPGQNRWFEVPENLPTSELGTYAGSFAPFSLSPDLPSPLAKHLAETATDKPRVIFFLDAGRPDSQPPFSSESKWIKATLAGTVEDLVWPKWLADQSKRDPTLVVWESTHKELLIDHFCLRMRAQELKIGPLSQEAVVQWAGVNGQPERVFQFSGGYPPAVRSLIARGDLAFREPCFEKACLQLVWQTMKKAGVFERATGIQLTTGPDYSDRLALKTACALADRAKQGKGPAGNTELTALMSEIQESQVPQAQMLEIRDKLGHLLGWARQGGRAGYVVTEPFQAIMAETARIYGQNIGHGLTTLLQS